MRCRCSLAARWPDTTTTVGHDGTLHDTSARQQPLSPLGSGGAPWPVFGQERLSSPPLRSRDWPWVISRRRTRQDGVELAKQRSRCERDPSGAGAGHTGAGRAKVQRSIDVVEQAPRCASCVLSLFIGCASCKLSVGTGQWAGRSLPLTGI